MGAVNVLHISKWDNFVLCAETKVERPACEAKNFPPYTAPRQDCGRSAAPPPWERKYGGSHTEHGAEIYVFWRPLYLCFCVLKVYFLWASEGKGKV